MPKLKVDLTDSGCRKPRCKRKFSKPHRHHKGNEKYFLELWDYVGPPENMYRWLEMFRNRYYAFRPKDTVPLCAWHHAEIHSLYNTEVYMDQFDRGKIINNYSWREAISLMRKLRHLCDDWLKEETPGRRPSSIFRYNDKEG